MSSPNLWITEPHPTVPKGGATYIGSARGGAGNYQRYKSEELTTGSNASGPPSRISLFKSFKRPSVVPTGRGGAGNMIRSTAADECIFQFDEELARRRDTRAPVYHIGRGGAANFVDERQPIVTKRAGSTSSSSSADSEQSTKSSMRVAIEKLTRRGS